MIQYSREELKCHMSVESSTASTILLQIAHAYANLFICQGLMFDDRSFCTDIE